MTFLLTPDQKCTSRVVIIRGFVGLPETDDPLKVKESQFSNVFYFKNYLIINTKV